MSTELLPCPFCGSDAGISRVKTADQYHFAECLTCYARIMAKPSRDEAAKAWNTRTENIKWQSISEFVAKNINDFEKKRNV
jgi:Lar family restriction alleviation protein